LAVTSYHTVNGRIRAESTGGARTGYLPDALGSVTATVQGGAMVNTYRYKPYGELLAKTGAEPNPRFRWVGCFGYNNDQQNLHYVRARHYNARRAQWTAQDSAWPGESSYNYCHGIPSTLIDPNGNNPLLILALAGGILLVGGCSSSDPDPCEGCDTMTDDELCKFSLRFASDDIKDKAHGWVACCKGKKVSCWAPQRVQKAYGCKLGDPICTQIRECIYLHEKRHEEQVGSACISHSGRRWKEAECGIWGNSNTDNAECDAYSYSIVECIMKKWPDIKCNRFGSTGVCRFISDQCFKFELHCNSAVATRNKWHKGAVAYCKNAFYS
jgi:RHS repeat-associated protein